MSSDLLLSKGISMLSLACSTAIGLFKCAAGSGRSTVGLEPSLLPTSTSKLSP